MRTYALVMMGLLYLVGTLVSLAIQAHYPTDAGSLFYTIMHMDWASFSNPLGAISGFFVLISGLVQAFLGILMWDYSFFVGPYVIFQYAGWVFSVAILITFALSLGRGTSSG